MAEKKRWQDLTVRPATSPEVDRSPDGTFTVVWGGGVNLAVLVTAEELAELIAAATRAQATT